MRTDDDIVRDLRQRIQTQGRRTSRGYCHLYPPSAAAAIDEAERNLALAFPPLLRRMYSEVGNGGFGPGSGLLGLQGGHRDGKKESLVAVNKWEGWPPGVLAAWDWGCAMWSCIDVTTPDGVIVTHDSIHGATNTTYSLRAWMDAWLDDVDLWRRSFDAPSAPSHPGVNPFTKEPLIFRGQPRPIGTPRPKP
jgi:hypothetical protein